MASTIQSRTRPPPGDTSPHLEAFEIFAGAVERSWGSRNPWFKIPKFKKIYLPRWRTPRKLSGALLPALEPDLRSVLRGHAQRAAFASLHSVRLTPEALMNSACHSGGRFQLVLMEGEFGENKRRPKAGPEGISLYHR